MSTNYFYLICVVIVGVAIAGQEHAEKMKELMCGDEVTEEGQSMIDCFNGLDWAGMTEFNEATEKCCQGKVFTSGDEVKEVLCDLSLEEIGECCDCATTELEGKFDEQLDAFRGCFPEAK